MAYDPIPRVNAAGVAVWSAKVAGDSNNRNQITADGQMSWGPGNAAVDTFMSRSAAGITAFGEVDGVAAHSVYLYGSRSASGVNYERVSVTTQAAASAHILTQAAGSGVVRDLQVGKSTAFWAFRTNSVQPSSDNGLDWGESGARIRSIYWGTQALGPNGSVSAASFGFALEVNSGLIRTGTGILSIALTGDERFRWDKANGRTVIGSAWAMTWSSTSTADGAPDLFLFRDAAGILAQRNGTNAQTFRIYNTFTDASNFEVSSIFWSGDTFRITTSSSGSGSSRGILLSAATTISFQTNGANSRWQMDTDGDFIATTDNSWDIGRSAATRPRSIYWGTQALGPDGAVGSPAFSFASQTTTGVYLAGAGDLRITNAGTDKFRITASGVILSADDNLQWGTSGVSGSGLTIGRSSNNVLTINGAGVFAEAVSTSGTPTAFTVTGAAHTTLATTVEAPGVLFDASAIKQWATGAIVAQREFKFMAPTYAFVGASVISDAATVYISGAPILGTNATFTRSFAFWVAGGISRFDGSIQPGSNNALDLGTSALTWRSVHVGTSISVGTNPATTGDFNMQHAFQFFGRNNANDANLAVLEWGETVTDGIYIGRGTGVAAIHIGAAALTAITLNPTDGGLRVNGQSDGAGASTGTLGNAPGATDPDFWLPISIAGVAHVFPCWTA